MASVGLITVNGNMVELTILSRSLTSGTTSIDSIEIEQLSNEIKERGLSEKFEERFFENRLEKIERMMAQDNTFLGRMNHNAYHRSGRSAVSHHRKYIRNGLISVISKVNSNFMCRHCHNPTFIDKNTGKNYVLSHHMLEYNETEDGPDVLENLIVLCPTCHDRIHHGTSQAVFELHTKLRRTNEINFEQFRIIQQNHLLKRHHISLLKKRGIITQQEAERLNSLF